MVAMAIAWSARSRLRRAFSKSTSTANWRSAPKQIRAIASTALTGQAPAAVSAESITASVPIYAFSRHAGARRKMALMRDVFPMDYDSRGQSPGEAGRGGIERLVQLGLLAPGDRVVFTSGEHMETKGATNTLRLLAVGDDGRATGLGAL